MPMEQCNLCQKYSKDLIEFDCEHKAHKKCIRRWSKLTKSKDCILCKTDFSSESGDCPHCKDTVADVNSHMDEHHSTVTCDACGLDFMLHQTANHINYLCTAVRCSICMKPVEEKYHLECGHAMHLQCMKKWNKISTICPLCIQSNEFDKMVRCPIDDCGAIKALKKWPKHYQKHHPGHVCTMYTPHSSCPACKTRLTKCPFCKETFDDWIKHYSYNHRLCVPNDFECPNCWKPDYPKKCPFRGCNDDFTIDHFLKQHEPYHCSICGDVMSLHHKDLHDNEVCPFKLAICPAHECTVRISHDVYVRQDGNTLKEDHDCQGLLSCDYCDKMFFKLEDLQEHILFKHDDDVDKHAPRRKVPKRAAAQRCVKDLEELRKFQNDPRYAGVNTITDVDIRDQVYEMSDSEEGESLDYDSESSDE